MSNPQASARIWEAAVLPIENLATEFYLSHEVYSLMLSPYSVRIFLTAVALYFVSNKIRIMKFYLLLLIALYTASSALAQNVGINTSTPSDELDVRSDSNAKGSDVNISNPDESYFLRLRSHTKTSNDAAIWWHTGKILQFSIADPDENNYTQFLGLDGKTIGIYNTGASIFMGQNAGNNDDGTDNRNIAIGNAALANNIFGKSNVAIGDSAMFYNSSVLSDVQASNNTAVGKSAMKANLTGSNNSALGHFSMFSNLTGDKNVAIGLNALRNNTNGDDNVALGVGSLLTNGSGFDNVAVGRDAMLSNTDGNNNIAAGRNSLFSNTMGEDNTALGRSAMQSSTMGSSNVVIGSNSMYHNQTGNFNTIVGAQAGYGSSGNNYSGNVFIGFNAGRNEANGNRLYIDNSSASFPLIYGEFNTDLVRVNGKMEVRSSGNGQLVIDSGTSSDAILQFTNDASQITNDWTIRRDASEGGNLVWRHSDFFKMALTPSGNLVLGDDQANGYKLSVDGKIIAEELKVELSGNWPDYVFAPEYNLMPLADLEKSIQKNKHLPGIPSAAEVADDGFEVGDMQKRLLEKVEELTLYIIQLEKRIGELEKD